MTVICVSSRMIAVDTVYRICKQGAVNFINWSFYGFCMLYTDKALAHLLLSWKQCRAILNDSNKVYQILPLRWHISWTVTEIHFMDQMSGGWTLQTVLILQKFIFRALVLFLTGTFRIILQIHNILNNSQISINLKKLSEKRRDHESTKIDSKILLNLSSLSGSCLYFMKNMIKKLRSKMCE